MALARVAAWQDDGVTVGPASARAVVARRDEHTTEDHDMAGDARLDRNGLLVLDEATCWALLSRTPVGRLGFALRGVPEIRPMNHLVHEGALLLVSRPGGKLDAVLANPQQPVVYEADAGDEGTRAGWSVMAHGHLQPVLDTVEQRTLDTLGPPAWIDSFRDRHWLRLRPARLTGRRLLGGRTAAGQGAG